MAYTFTLKENVLTDNELILASPNKVFKGRYIAIIKEYVFANSWGDREIIKRFRSEKSLFNYLDKNYPDLDYCFDGTCLCP